MWRAETEDSPGFFLQWSTVISVTFHMNKWVIIIIITIYKSHKEKCGQWTGVKTLWPCLGGFRQWRTMGEGGSQRFKAWDLQKHAQAYLSGRSCTYSCVYPCFGFACMSLWISAWVKKCPAEPRWERYGVMSGLISSPCLRLITHRPLGGENQDKSWGKNEKATWGTLSTIWALSPLLSH